MPQPISASLQKSFEPLEPELVKALVGRIEEILPLPGVVNAILKTANDPYASLDRLAETILKDQALTAKVLKIINSAYYGLPQRVTTVSQAVSYMGLEKIKNLAMAISLSDRLYRWSGLPGGKRGLWQHSQACGVATSLLIQAAGHHFPEEALIVGLLHDIAKALWSEVFPERFLAAMQAVEHGWPPQAAEKEFLAVDHATVGAWMLEKWQLPEVFQKAVRNHHKVKAASESGLRVLHHALYAGNILAKLLNLGNSGNNHLGPLPSQVCKSLQVTRAQMVQCLRELPAAFGDYVKGLDLNGLEPPASLPLGATLHGREVWLWQQGVELGPASLVFEALAPKVSLLDVNQVPQTLASPAALVFWEGTDPEPVLEQWQHLPLGGHRPLLILFCHGETQWQAPPPQTPHGVHLLGPEWRLEELIRLLGQGKRAGDRQAKAESQ